jgi:hypothetical protein
MARVRTRSKRNAGEPVNPKTTAIFLIVSLSALVTGCATPAAPEYGGRWRPVNRFSEAPQEIALQRAYLFYASPLDATLKTMLERWAADSKMTLDYHAPVDYTLYAPVAEVRTNDLASAVARLSDIYSEKRLAVSVESKRIVVRMSEAPGTASGGVVAP